MNSAADAQPTADTESRDRQPPDTGPPDTGPTETSNSTAVASLPPIDLAAFTCPRCAATVGEEFYGPCSSCREQLRATIRNEAADIVAAEYEPKMNVTPNAVASKE